MPMASTTLASSSLAALALILDKGVPEEAGRVLELAPAPKVSYRWCATRLAAPCGGQGRGRRWRVVAREQMLAMCAAGRHRSGDMTGTAAA